MTAIDKTKKTSFTQSMPLHSILVDTTLPFDILVKEDGKFNILKTEGTLYTLEIQNDLVCKGIEELYTPVMNKENYINYVNKYIKKILLNKQIDDVEKCLITYHHSKSVMEELLENPDSKVALSRVRVSTSAIIDTLLVDQKALKSFIEIGGLNYSICSHSVDVSIYATALAVQLGLPRAELFRVGYAGMLHDIGKVRVDSKILNKKEELTPEEFKEIQKHPVYSYQLLKSHNEMNETILNGILYHHEKFNGSGYPHGIKGDRIPLIAQILSIADIFSAITTHKSYNNGKSTFESLKELKAMKKELNPKLIGEFIKVMTKACKVH
ncbi:MAG: HD-GYP domain-containing protein [Campylobacterales bacterium]|nr:HD-GYP domain-containing protein [Campylobacterales bacterium]